MTDIKVYENISIVTFSDVPSRKRFVSTTLSAVAESGINVDMISQTPPKSALRSAMMIYPHCLPFYPE